MIKTALSFKSLSLSLLSFALLFTSAASPALAEYWSPSGNNIYKNNFGNVGIGTSSPTTPLHVNIDTSTYGAIRVSEGATPAIDLGDATGVGVNGIAALFSGGVEKIRLFADPTQNSWINAGNVGIGTISPDSKLTVSGTTKLTGNPVSTPVLTVDSWADGKYSAYIVGPNPGLAIRNTGDPATTGLYKFTSSGNALLLYQNTAAAGDFSSQNNIMTWKAGGNVGIGGIPGSYKLDVAGTAKASGAVGVNGSNPGAIVGGQATGLAVTGYSGLGGLRLNGADTTNTIYQSSGNLGITAAPGSNVSLGDTNGPVITVKNGNVGINNINPTSRLSVNGDVSITSGNLRPDGNRGTAYSAVINTTGWKTVLVTFPYIWSSAPIVVVSRYDAGGTMTIPEIVVSNVTQAGFVIRFNVTNLTLQGFVQFNWMAL